MFGSNPARNVMKLKETNFTNLTEENFEQFLIENSDNFELLLKHVNDKSNNGDLIEISNLNEKPKIIFFNFYN